MVNKCPWCLKDPIYERYHDEEWGVPVHDDNKHFEFIVLESAQAGLSWLTVLKKREGYRFQYEDFDFNKVANFNEDKIENMLLDKNIIRNRRKIEASINNAKVFIKIREEFGSFDNYIWSYVNGEPIINSWKTLEELPARTELSDTVSSDLKRRGFKFFGTTIAYAHMQATGIINDHLVDCFKY